MQKIAIISPCCNEELAVDNFFNAIFGEIEKNKNYDFEIILVNDGSLDSTLPRLSEYAQNDSRITIIDLNRNFGKEVALTAALDHVECDAAIIIDFDLQDPPHLISNFIKKWEEGYESVVGVRADRSSDGFLKRKTAEIFYSTYNSFASVKIPENAGDCRLVDCKIIKQLRNLPERQRFMKGLFSWVGAKSAYVNYSRQKRDFGTSKFSGWKLWNFAIEGITSFSTIPLRIWTYIGIAIAAFSFIYAFFIVARAMVFGVDVPGYSSIIVTILFLGGIQIIGIGIIGEYLGRIYMEVKQRPAYLIRQIVKKTEK